MGNVFLPSFGTANKCEISQHHTPVPLRYVWHHILPQTCGGKTIAANLIEVCDNCHYGIHALLYSMKLNNGKVDSKYSHLIGSQRYNVAKAGYQAALDTNTVSQIPNEGAD